MRRAPLRFFAAAPPAQAQATPPSDSGPVEIPGKFIRSNVFFPESDVSAKREAKFHLAKKLHDVMKKRLDMMIVEDTLAPKQPIVIHPLRNRHDLDTIDHLHSKRLLPLHVYPRGDLPGLDVVIDQTQIKALKHCKGVYFRPVYLRYNNENIRCTVDKLIMSPDRAYYVKVYLTRYIVGRPNIISVELELPVANHDGFLKKRIEWITDKMKLVSYNDVNPTKIVLDYKRLARNGRITFGDLQNILPKGLELLPKDQQNLKYNIVILDSLQSKIEADVMHLKKMSAVEEEPVVISATADNTELGFETIKQLDMVERKDHLDSLIQKKEPKPQKEYISYKKLIKVEQARLKIELENKLARANVLMGNAGKPKK